MAPCEIRLISAEETIAVRWPILRPGFPRESAIFDGDDRAGARHFGSFSSGRITGVASIYEVPLPERPDAEGAWQLRGMATLDESRGAGHGSALLAACLAEVRKQGGKFLWCNARRVAVGFYQKMGFRTLGNEFDIPTVGPHFRMFIGLDQGSGGSGERIPEKGISTASQ